MLVIAFIAVAAQFHLGIHRVVLVEHVPKPLLPIIADLIIQFVDAFHGLSDVVDVALGGVNALVAEVTVNISPLICRFFLHNQQPVMECAEGGKHPFEFFQSSLVVCVHGSMVNG